MAGGIDRFAFSRFSEKRNFRGGDVSGYDEHIEGVEADETASLDTPIAEDNLGYRLIQKMGWTSGTGLGKHKQGRVDPVPIHLKDDYLGLGRWTMELEQAQDATEKRRQMEVEKDITPDLVEKYKQQAEKEQQIAETIAEMRKYFYCDLCDKQYTKYTEWDNHLNSYSHHHKQRLKDLQQYETGRRFGGHRNLLEEREKMVAAHLVAIERAQMAARRKTQSGFAPAFKPIGQDSTNQQSSFPQQTPTPSITQGVKRPHETDTESSQKIAEKKARIAKFGLKFQSAGTLVTVTDGLAKMTPGERSMYQIPTLPGSEESQCVDSDGQSSARQPSEVSRSSEQMSNESEEVSNLEDTSSGERKFSFGFSKKAPVIPQKAPPRLMSKTRHVTMTHAFSQDSDSDEDDTLQNLAKLPKRGAPRFKFNIKK